MKDTLGDTLGNILAILEEEVRTNPENIEALEKIQKISAIYCNFCDGNFKEFRRDFEQGYDFGKSHEVMNRETAGEHFKRVYGCDPTPD